MLGFCLNSMQGNLYTFLVKIIDYFRSPENKVVRFRRHLGWKIEVLFSFKQYVVSDISVIIM